MGNRLTRIYTRTGDTGETGLGDGSRICKDSLRVEAMGDVDELNCVIGLVLSHEIPDDIAEILESLQHDLFDLGGELSMPGHALVSDARVVYLEETLDRYNSELPALKEFILPGGGKAAGFCHLARAVARRAERQVVRLGRNEPINEAGRAYLNRLSDLLFVLSRVLSREAGEGEVLWHSGRAT
jgi:cob(I)alamin adenosyltransferase